MSAAKPAYKKFEGSIGAGPMTDVLAAVK